MIRTLADNTWAIVLVVVIIAAMLGHVDVPTVLQNIICSVPFMDWKGQC